MYQQYTVNNYMCNVDVHVVHVQVVYMFNIDVVDVTQKCTPFYDHIQRSAKWNKKHWKLVTRTSK